MHSANRFLITLLWVAVPTIPAVTSADDQPARAAPPSGGTAGDQPVPAADGVGPAETILQLRQAIGRRLLEGTMLDQKDDDADLFIKALREITETMTTRPARWAAAPSSDAIVGSDHEPAATPDEPDEAGAGLTSLLRTTARALDRHADGLEDRAQYERADRLRKLGRRLRKTARQLD